MRRKTRWIVSVRDKNGRLSTEILRFEPKVGAVLSGDLTVIEVMNP